MRGVAELAGQIEIRGLGLRTLDFVPEGRVGLVVDLAAADAERLPPPRTPRAVCSDDRLLRLPIAAGDDALLPVLAFLTTT